MSARYYIAIYLRNRPKETDNAEAQREKEKTTLYTRGKILDVLNEVIPLLVDTTLKVHDTMKKRKPRGIYSYCFIR